jgi:DUF4097 and DUF4098 domain-containing protein YvlB
LNAKNFVANIDENATFNVKKNTEIKTGEDLNISAKNVAIDIDEDMNGQIGGKWSQTAHEITIEASNGDLKLSGKGQASLQGGSNVKISKS